MQRTRNKTAFTRELVKHIQSSPNAKSITESLERSVKGRSMSGVDVETAEKFKKQGNVDVLELMDIGHLTRCEHRKEQQPPGRIYRLCGEQVPNLQLECEQKNPRGYSDSCQGTLATERDVLENGYGSSHKRRRYSRITKSIQRPTTSQNEALRESEEQMELELFTLAVPTDGADTPSFVNAWKREGRTQTVMEKWDEVARLPNLEQTGHRKNGYDDMEISSSYATGKQEGETPYQLGNTPNSASLYNNHLHARNKTRRIARSALNRMPIVTSKNAQKVVDQPTPWPSSSSQG